MVIELAAMIGYRSELTNQSSYEEYSLQSFVLMARLQTESGTNEKLKKRHLGFSGVS
jgi:hypothetical protein